MIGATMSENAAGVLALRKESENKNFAEFQSIYSGLYGHFAPGSCARSELWWGSKRAPCGSLVLERQSAVR